MGTTPYSGGEEQAEFSATLSAEEMAQLAKIDDAVFTSAQWLFLSLFTIADYYTGPQIDSLLLSHTHDGRYYTEDEIDSMFAEHAALSHTHDDRYYTEDEIDSLLSDKSDTTHNHDLVYAALSHNHDSAYAALSHTHDDRYYTESEITTLLAGKSDSTHNHDSDYADISHTHDEDDLSLSDVTTGDVNTTRHGFCPKLPGGQELNLFLRMDGSWAEPSSANGTVTNGDSHDHIGGDGSPITEEALSLSDVTTADASASRHGFLKKLSDNETQYMNGAGNWTVPADGDAIHGNVSAEINAITAKTGLSLSDIFVIEDYAASWAKKKATLGNMLKVKRGLTSITSNTTISSLTRDETYIVNASSMITLTLPDASTYAGYEVTVYLASDHGVTISPASGNTIGGFSSGPQLSNAGDHIRLLAMSDDNWIILGMLSTYDSGILACSDWTTRNLGSLVVLGTWTGTPVVGETFTQYTNAACTTQSNPAMTGILHFSVGDHGAFRNVSGSGGCFITGYYLKGSVSGAVLKITAGSKNMGAATTFQCAVFVGDKQISKLTYLPTYNAGNEEYDIYPYVYGTAYSVGRYISSAYVNESYEIGASGFQYTNYSQTVTTVASTNAFYRITRQAII